MRHCEQWVSGHSEVSTKLERQASKSAMSCANSFDGGVAEGGERLVFKAPCVDLREVYAAAPSICEDLATDEEWPAFTSRPDGVLDGTHLLDALGNNSVVTFIGASMVVTSSLALRCSLLMAAGRARRAGNSAVGAQHAAKWQLKTHHSPSLFVNGCDEFGRVRGDETSMKMGSSREWNRAWRDPFNTTAQQRVLECISANTVLLRAIDSSTAVVIGMRTDHNGWDPRVLEPQLRWVIDYARRRGVRPLLLTQTAQHFASLNGDYSSRRVQKSEECGCLPLQFEDDGGATEAAGDSPQISFVRLHRRLGKELGVAVVDLFRATAHMPFQHLGDMCADHPPRTIVGGKQMPWDSGFKRRHLARRLEQITSPTDARQFPTPVAALGHGRRLAPADRHDYRKWGNDRLGKRRLCCDCTHYCHTPALWDEALLTPLVRILSASTLNGGQHLRHHARLKGGKRKGRG